MSDTEFEKIRTEFESRVGLSREELRRELMRDQTSSLAKEWHKELSAKMPQYCTDCHVEHKPTAECVPCEFSRGFLHHPTPKDIYFDYRGWKWTPPFICMGCGIEVCHNQWAFSRSCGPCDVSRSKTRRLLYGKCFVGPHVKLATWNERDGDIPESHFVNPEDRLKYPVMRMPKLRFPTPHPHWRKRVQP